jgi:hypothetical protein
MALFVLFIAVEDGIPQERSDGRLLFIQNDSGLSKEFAGPSGPSSPCGKLAKDHASSHAACRRGGCVAARGTGATAAMLIVGFVTSPIAGAQSRVLGQRRAAVGCSFLSGAAPPCQFPEFAQPFLRPGAGASSARRGVRRS